MDNSKSANICQQHIDTLSPPLPLTDKKEHVVREIGLSTTRLWISCKEACNFVSNKIVMNFRISINQIYKQARSFITGFVLLLLLGIGLCWVNSGKSSLLTQNITIDLTNLKDYPLDCMEWS